MSDSENHKNEMMFRFLLISMVRQREMAGEDRASIIRDLASRTHLDISGGKSRRVSIRSLYRWLKDFEKNGITGIETKPTSI